MKMNTAQSGNGSSRYLPGETRAYAHRWFFTAACIYAALIIPLTLLARHGFGPTVLSVPTGHAFEMLFGLAPALIAGYLLGPMPAKLACAGIQCVVRHTVCPAIAPPPVGCQKMA